VPLKLLLLATLERVKPVEVVAKLICELNEVIEAPLTIIKIFEASFASAQVKVVDWPEALKLQEPNTAIDWLRRLLLNTSVPLAVKISKPWVLSPAVPDCPLPGVPPPEGAATVVMVQVLSTPPTSIVTVELVLYVEGALLLT
tara:strand:+ start:1480 stop:1908 length:429 start_codon:yes stop_codon:yes gene_type:complete